MININRRLPFIRKLLRETGTKVKVYMSYKTVGDDYDPFEKNYTYNNNNPRTLKGYVTEISPEGLVWKSYGLQEMGAKEVVCDEKYRYWFINANKIEIDGDEFEVFKEGTGNRALIQSRPYRLIRVVLQKKA